MSNEKRAKIAYDFKKSNIILGEGHRGDFKSNTHSSFDYGKSGS